MAVYVTSGLGRRQAEIHIVGYFQVTIQYISYKYLITCKLKNFSNLHVNKWKDNKSFVLTKQTKECGEYLIFLVLLKLSRVIFFELVWFGVVASCFVFTFFEIPDRWIIFIRNKFVLMTLITEVDWFLIGLCDWKVSHITWHVKNWQT
jgi:hypothetical protein